MIQFYIVDPTWWLYVASVLAAAWGFVLFSWWWIKTWKITGERPSSVFICLWLVFLGEFLDSSISVHMRSNVISLGYANAHSFFRSWLWSARVIPVLLGMTAIDIIMTYRIMFKKTVFKANGHKKVEIKGGTVEYAHLKDAEPVKLEISGKRVEVAILRKATNEVVVVLDAIVKEIN
jgi:hypothetical protein